MYDVPLEPVTWIEAALVSVTVRVSVCPEEMLFELALIETVGTDAAALAANAEIATKVRRGAREGPKDFISSHKTCILPDLRSGARYSRGKSPPKPVRYRRIQEHWMRHGNSQLANSALLSGNHAKEGSRTAANCRQST